MYKDVKPQEVLFGAYCSNVMGVSLEFCLQDEDVNYWAFYSGLADKCWFLTPYQSSR
jgi:hypothetical protein